MILYFILAIFWKVSFILRIAFVILGIMLIPVCTDEFDVMKWLILFCTAVRATVTFVPNVPEWCLIAAIVVEAICAIVMLVVADGGIRKLGIAGIFLYEQWLTSTIVVSVIDEVIDCINTATIFNLAVTIIVIFIIICIVT